MADMYFEMYYACIYIHLYIYMHIFKNKRTSSKLTFFFLYFMHTHNIDVMYYTLRTNKEKFIDVMYYNLKTNKEKF